MSLIDIIKNFKNSEPDIKKISKGLLIYGCVCFGIGLWNIIIFSMFKEMYTSSFFNLPNNTIDYILLIFAPASIFSISGFFVIKSNIFLGKIFGIISLLFFIIGLLVFYSYFYNLISIYFDKFNHLNSFKTFFKVFMIVPMAQFLIPLFFGISYISRLKHKKS